jgi:hypothetical protein
MTAPHPFPTLAAIAALAAAFFAVLAMWLPAGLSGLDIGSGGQPSATSSRPVAAQATSFGETHNVFKQPITAPLW